MELENAIPEPTIAFLKGRLNYVPDTTEIIVFNSEMHMPDQWERKIFQFQQKDDRLELLFGRFDMYPAITTGALKNFLSENNFDDNQKFSIHCTDSSFQKNNIVIEITFENDKLYIWF